MWLPLYLDSLVTSLKDAYCVSSLILPDGEASKSMHTLTHILDTMIAAGFLVVTQRFLLWVAV